MRTGSSRLVQASISSRDSKRNRTRRRTTRRGATALENLESRLLLAVTPTTPYYHAGDLDPTFGGGTGLITSPVTVNGNSPTISMPYGFWGYPNVYKSAIQTYGVSTPQLVVVTPIGAGSLTTTPDATNPYTDSQGNPIVFGTALTIARYDTQTGAEDTSFTRTIANTDLGSYFANRSIELGGIAIQADGKIVIAGTTALYPMSTSIEQFDVNAFVIRLNANGTLDTTFDTEGKVDGVKNDGVVVYDFARGQETINAVALGAGGRIYVGGSVTLDPALAGNNLLMISFNPDGSIDNSFGTDGRFVATADGNEPPVPLPDPPSYWIGGMYGDTYFNSSYMQRIGAPTNGTSLLADLLNPYTGNVGIYTTNLLNGSPRGVHVKTSFTDPNTNTTVNIDQDVDLSSATTVNDVANLLTAVLAPAGASVTVALGGTYVQYVLHANADNDLVISEITDNNVADTMATELGILGTATKGKTYTGDVLVVPAPPTTPVNLSYNMGPVPGVNDRTYDDQFQVMMVQPDGKIIAAGQVYGGTPSNTKVLIARFNPNGTPDTTFGVGGYFIHDFNAGDGNGGGEDVINALAYRPSSTGSGYDIIFGGYTVVGGSVANYILNPVDTHWSRLPPTTALIGVVTPSGQLNTSFLGGGYQASQFTGAYSLASSMFTSIQLQSDNKILAVGTATSSLSYGQGIMLVRFNPDGSLDHNFGVAGVAIAAVDTTTYSEAWTPGKYDDKKKGFPSRMTSIGEASDIPVNVYLDPVNGAITLIGYSMTTAPFDSLSKTGKIVFPPGSMPTIPSNQIIAYPMDFSAKVGYVELLRFTNDTPNYQTDTVPPQSYLQPLAPVNTALPTYQFELLYTDNSAIKLSSIDSLDVYVTGPNGFTTNATLVKVGATSGGSGLLIDQSPIYATYVMTGPAGGWIKGTYSIYLRPTQVSDTYANYAVGGLLGTFLVDNVPDTQQPVVAAVAASDIAVLGGSAYDFQITFSDDVGINVASLSNANVTVYGPKGYIGKATFVSVSPNSNGTPRAATYRILAPGGTWDAADGGTYTITMNPSQVADTAYPLGDSRLSWDPTYNITHFVAAGGIGTFKVNVPDTTAPSATLAAALPTINIGDTSLTFTVTFTDDVAINVGSIATGNVHLIRGAVDMPATLVSIDTNANGSPRNATFTIAPAGGFTSALVGSYVLRILGGLVTDTSGNAVPQTDLGTVVLGDVIAPVAALAAAPTGTAAGSTACTFQVSYSDNIAVDASSISSGDIHVTGPNGFSQFASLVSIQPKSNAGTVVATYQFIPPGGAWTPAAAGDYVLTLLGSRVKDTAGNYVASAVLTTLNINPDATAPTASVDGPDLAGAIGAYQFTVTYHDDRAMNPALTYNSGQDIQVLTPSGKAIYGQFVSRAATADGKGMQVTYTIPAPGGSWDPSDSGAYTVRVLANRISDNSGNYVPASNVGVFYYSATPFFSERFYQARNPDVVAAIASGAVASGYDHFIKYGQYELRQPTPFFDEAYYRTNYPDVAAAVASHAISSGWEHFVEFGARENRQPSAFFNPAYYLANNPDVAAGVAHNITPSAFVHYLTYGYNEGRSPAPGFESGAYYLSQYADVASLVTAGSIRNPLEHYFTYGQYEQRDYTPYFDEAYYLSHNADVAAAVAAGTFSSGYQHFLAYGQREGRSPSTLYSETDYLAFNPDVAAAVRAGAFISGFDHFIRYGRFEGRIAHA